MAYEMVMPYHLHMPSYFLETFTEYPAQSKLFSGEQTSPENSKILEIHAIHRK